MKRSACCLSVLLLLSVPLSGQQKPPGAEPQGLREVTVDPVLLTNVGVALTLRARGNGDHVDMVIGLLEGQSIEMARRGEKAPRPMTHDIFKTFLDRNGWKVERVVVRDLVNGTFLADLVLQKDGQKQVYDARPSDAIALAVRYGATIFVAEKVFVLHKQQAPPERPAKPNTATRTRV